MLRLIPSSPLLPPHRTGSLFSFGNLGNPSRELTFKAED
jgi:hypothetical protein